MATQAAGMRRVWLHEGRGASHLLPERKRTPIGSRSKGRVARRAGKAPGGHAEANATLAAQAGVAWKVGSAMALAVTNRVAQKLALVPMEGHILFLSLLVSCGYVAVYGGVLSYKVARGDVPLSDLRMLPFRLFLLVGLGEACGSALSLFGASGLPGAVLPLLNQTVVVWQMVWSKALLGKQFRLHNFVGALLVICGVLAVTSPGGGVGRALLSASWVYLAAYLASAAPPALGTIIKEKIFREAREKLGGRELDIFAVNTFGSGFQAAFTLSFLPLFATLRGIGLDSLPSYFSEGARLVLGQSSAAFPGASLAPTLVPLYLASNVAFNIAALVLLRSTGAVVSSLTLSASVPATSLCFALLPLPLLPQPTLGLSFWLGAAVLLLGLLVYNFPGSLPSSLPQLRRS